MVMTGDYVFYINNIKKTTTTTKTNHIIYHLPSSNFSFRLQAGEQK